MEYLQPDFLQPGDHIGITATARKVSRAEIQPAINLIKRYGYIPILGNNLFANDNQFAGTDKQRRDDLQRFLDDKQIKAILCARGGYGSVRIVDFIDFSVFNQSPKWICGFSDVTVLHSHLHQQFKVQSMHSAMPLTFPPDGSENKAVTSLFHFLSGEKQTYSFPCHPLNRPGNSSGILIGGNLSIIYSLSASVSDINTQGKILLLEDLDEYLYHIDRMMMNLKRAGKLENLKGLLIGGMSEMRDNTIPFGKTAEEIIAESVKEYHYPLVFNVPAGHIEDNRALVMGAEIYLCADNPGQEVRIAFL